jgi:RNA polymerase sigma-70 factor (ECF subfamily)
LQQDIESVQAPTVDAELITRAQNGDVEAFEALFHVYKRRVFRLCLRMIKNPADAEELTQEAFLTLFRKIHTFRGESAFSTWLLRISMNIVLMRLRKKVPKEILSLDSSDEDKKSEWSAKEYGSSDLLQTGIIDRLSLEAAIEQLPPGYRQVFEMHDVLGWQHDEIADILGYSVGNSKSQLFKARLRLRKLLGRRMRPNRRRPKQSERNSEPSDELATACCCHDRE